MELELKCSRCGNPVEASASAEKYQTVLLDVDPCDVCIQEAKDEVREDDRQQMKADG